MHGFVPFSVASLYTDGGKQLPFLRVLLNFYAIKEATRFLSPFVGVRLHPGTRITSV